MHHGGVGGGEEERGREEVHKHGHDEEQVQPRALPMPSATARWHIHVGSGARGSDMTIGKLEWHSYSPAKGPVAARGRGDPLTTGEEEEAEVEARGG
jgi:hypothetical protein